MSEFSEQVEKDIEDYFAHNGVSAREFNDIVSDPAVATLWAERVRKANEVYMREMAEVRERTRAINEKARRTWCAWVVSKGGVTGAVLRHHSPDTSRKDEYGLACAGCDAGDYSEDPPTWPCSTVKLLAYYKGGKWNLR